MTCKSNNIIIIYTRINSRINVLKQIFNKIIIDLICDHSDHRENIGKYVFNNMIDNNVPLTSDTINFILTDRCISAEIKNKLLFYMEKHPMRYRLPIDVLPNIQSFTF